MQKLLIANRGEIALRIIRSAREMGIATVAVYSEADRDAPHVRAADEAVLLGPPPSAQSYLRIDRILAACERLGVDAIHPGFGFLSENADFARAVTEAGITFVGPRPHAIEVMGSKLAAKAAVAEYDTPLVPGTDEAITDIEAAKTLADDIGYPILIKASAGGGGKGMRVVNDRAEFETQMRRAISEATSSFGDGSVFIEKFVEGPRHIEIQVLADTHGNVVHLFERECSIQRRHQKVIEEAPSSVLAPELRERMGQDAINVAKACDYVGAGTVEFLLDAHMNYYFLEMNTRLQVEHPVTEMVTGLDLVKEQIRVARGEALSVTQSDLRIHGHAIELRVYAEDPSANFLPDIGCLEVYRKPEGPGIRVDDGFEEGMDIPIHYDPMIAKLAVWGADRTEAIARMKRAIAEYRIVGVENTLSFGRFVMDHPAFVSGDFTTHFVNEHFDPASIAPSDDPDSEALAAFLAASMLTENRAASRPVEQTGTSDWARNRSFMKR